MQRTLQSLIPTSAGVVSAGVVAGLSFAFVSSGAFANPDCVVDCGSAPSTHTSTTTVDVDELTSTAIAAPTASTDSYNWLNPNNVNYNLTEGAFSRNAPVGNNTTGIAFQSVVGCNPLSYGMATENAVTSLDFGYLGGISLNIPRTTLAAGVGAEGEGEMLTAMKNANEAQRLSIDIIRGAMDGTMTQQQLATVVEVYVATQTRCNLNNVTTVVEQQPVQVQQEPIPEPPEPPAPLTTPTRPRG